MRTLSVGQKKSLSEFFANGAVAWLTVGIISPLFTGGKVIDFIGSVLWGSLFTVIFLIMSLLFTKGIKS